MIKKFNLHINITPETTVTNDNSIVNNNKITNKLLPDAIVLEEVGVYIGSTNGWQMEKKLLDSVLPKRPDIIDIQDKKLYRWPHLDLPRQKVDLLKDKFNCKVIRNVDKADIEIISMNGMRKLIEMDWHASFTYSGMHTFLTFLKAADILTESSLARCRQVLDGVPKESRINITRDYPWNINSSDYPQLLETSKIIAKHLDNERPKSNGREAIVKGKDKVDIYHHIINTSSQVVFDVDINNIIDEDLAVIENTELENITQMIKSSDRENRSLALEMLANCNVNKSFDVVSNIYYWHYDWLKDTNNWNTVNVKALRAKMKTFEGGGSIGTIYSYNSYIKNLVEHDKLTKFAIDDTRKRLYKNIISDLAGTDNEGAVFNIDIESITLKNKLIENIINE